MIAALISGCAGVKPEPETAVPEMAESSVSTEAPSENVDTVEAEPLVPFNIWDIMDNEGVEEIELLRGLEVADIDAWQKNSPFSEIKLYQRTILETLRLGTVGDVVVAQFVSNPDVYQTDYDYSGDPVWNVRMEKSDSLKNTTGIEIPEDAWYGEYTINRPKGQATVVCYDWPIEGSPEDKTAPVKTVELYIAYFEDTQNLYSFYTDKAVYKWNGEYWDNNMARGPYIVLSYIEADGPDYYKYISEYDLTHNRGDVQYFRIRSTGEMKTYQFEVGMTLEQWVNSKYNTDAWTFIDDGHGFYKVCSPDGKYKFNKDAYVWGVMYP